MSDRLKLKPLVRLTLESIADGTIVVEVDHRRKCGYLKRWGERYIAPGVYTLFNAGYLDQDGKITPEGREASSAP